MSQLKIVATGDLHFGHLRLPASELYGKLQEYLYPELEDADILLLTGDIYHDISTVSSKAHVYVTKFMRDLALMSEKTGLIVRVLHGTYSHDRDQLSVISSYVPRDIRIVNDIEVETIYVPSKEASLTVGYLPDNLPYKKSSDALAHLKDLMMLAGVNQLNLVLGHGNFVHVLPENVPSVPPCLYDISQFRGLSKYLIFGHHHVPSKRGNMVYCGSFDRMQHGEEETKGINVFHVQVPGYEWNHEFIPNHKANLFKTIVPTGDNFDDTVDDFLRQVDELFPDGNGYVRCMHHSGELRALIGKVCAKMKPNLMYTHKSNNKVDDAIELKLDDLHLEFDDVKPTVNNLGDLVYQFLHDNNHVESTHKGEILKSVETLLTPTGG